MAGRPGFAELFAALPVAVVVVDPDDRIAHANGMAEELLNLVRTRDARAADRRDPAAAERG